MSTRIEDFRIKELKVIPIRFERGHDHHTIDSRITATYEEREYHTKPKSKQEAEAQGASGFNGLMSSCPVIAPYIDSDGQAIVAAHIMPTRYLIGQAMRDLVGAGGLDNKTIQEISPDMCGVSVIVPAKYEGQNVIIAQVKGKALGAGQIHGAASAGNVAGKYVADESIENPLLKALQSEVLEELGIPVSTLSPSDFIYFVNERPTGQINFATIARGADAEKIFAAYAKSVQGQEYSNVEVQGLALIPLENPESIREKTRVFELNESGKCVWKEEQRGLRPYTEALVNHLADKEKRNYLLDKAGL